MSNQLDVFNLDVWTEIELSNLLSKETQYGESSIFHTHLANVYELNENYNEALKHREKAAMLSDNSVFKHQYANAARVAKDDKRALSILLECHLDTDPIASLRLALINLEQGDLEKSKYYAHRSLDVDYLNPNTRMFLGALALFENTPDLAIRHFKVALESNISSSPMFVNMAYAYCQLGQRKQSLKCLRKALLINPLNINALIFFADLAFEENKIDESIPKMESYVRYERDNAAIWERLARAYFFVTSDDPKVSKSYLYKALECLKCQRAIKHSASIYSNIGLIYSELKDTAKAIRFMNLALLESTETKRYEHVLTNLIILHLETNNAKTAINISESYVSKLSDAVALTVDQQKLIVFYLRCLEREELHFDLKNFVEKVIDRVTDPQYILECYTCLIYEYAVEYNNKEGVLNIVDGVLNNIKLLKNSNSNVRTRVLNNLCFALFQFNELKLANEVLSLLTDKIKIDPFVTATFGMSMIMKGSFQKGEEYYKIAIRLLLSKSDKHKFKQRLNFELGREFFNRHQYSASKRYLIKAKNEKNGLISVAKRASAILQTLQNNS